MKNLLILLLIMPMVSFGEENNFNLICEGRELIKNTLTDEYVSEGSTKKTYLIENGYWQGIKASIRSDMILLQDTYKDNAVEITNIATIDRVSGEATEITFTKDKTASVELMFNFNGKCVNSEKKAF